MLSRQKAMVMYSMYEGPERQKKTWGKLMCIKGRYISIRELFVVLTLLPKRIRYWRRNFSHLFEGNFLFLASRSRMPVYQIYLFWMMLLPRKLLEEFFMGKTLRGKVYSSKRMCCSFGEASEEAAETFMSLSKAEKHWINKCHFERIWESFESEIKTKKTCTKTSSDFYVGLSERFQWKFSEASSGGEREESKYHRCYRLR